MRGKENATDYRYFPNPEVMPIVIEKEWIDSIRATLPETAHDKFVRLTRDLGLPEYDSRIITGSKRLADIFDAATKCFDKPREVANWIIVELLAIAKGDNKGEDDINIDCQKFAKLMELVDRKTINRTVGKKLLALVLAENIDPIAYVEANKLGMVSDTDVISAAIQAVLADNAKAVNEYKGGNQKVLGFLVGQIMKKLGGKADPKIINKILMEQLR
jgi:aspartyl-tRNA(Asn)/glutamyl-tRNA(Gln) amidotransferase subunit B